MAIDLARVDSIISRHGTGREALIALMLDIQHAFSYLPPEALERVAEHVGVPAVQVYGLARFYKAFSLKPRAAHVISVCAGTACYVRDGVPLIEEIERLLHIAPGETTPDGQFTLETVNCPGNCPAGPVMLIDGVCHGRVAASQVASLVAAAQEAVS